MKKLQQFAACCLLLTFFSCSNNASQDNANQTFYGEKFNLENVVESAGLKALAQQGKATDIIVTGKVNSVCQKKGCWMTIDLGNKEEMRVTFKDYGFFVPKDCAGKEATFKGAASFDTTAVDVLKHYAEDEGLAQEEIDKITEPEIALVFEASGVVLK